MTRDRTTLEDRIRTTLAAVSEATPVDEVEHLPVPEAARTPPFARNRVLAAAAIAAVVGVGVVVGAGAARDDGTVATADSVVQPEPEVTQPEPQPDPDVDPSTVAVPTTPDTVGDTAAAPSVGPIPASAWDSAGGVDLAAIPDYIPTVGAHGAHLGYVRAIDLFPASAQPERAPIEVVADDLTTVVGHVHAGSRFVPLGADPAMVAGSVDTPTVYGVPLSDIPLAGPQPSTGGPTGTVLLHDGRVIPDDSLADEVDGRTLTEVETCMVVNTGPGEISEPVCRTVPIEEAQQGLGDDGQEIGIPRVVGGILVKGLLDLLPPGQSVVVVGTPDDAP